MKKKGRKHLRKEEVAEDWCFVCKEGGDLLICDYRQCLKAYHVHCVGKDESFLTSEERWNCNWHCCFICQKMSSFHCHCCPKAVCRHCINTAEFVVVRGSYGFCCNCLNLALLIEENRDVDSDGETVDFKDLKTYEGLFMDYYSKMIKGKKRFTLDNLRTAKDKLKTGKFDLDEFDDDEDDEAESDYESEDVMEDFKLKRRKECKSQLPLKKAKNDKSKKMQFSGWGSTALIQFLESIGQDTGKELHQHKVETLIYAYIKEHKLFDPEKKRKILCDEKLQTIFRRKFVNRSKIYSMLEPHFVNNLEKSEEEDEEDEEDEEIAFNSGDEDDNALVACKMRRKLKEEKDSPKNKQVHSAPQSSFAAITAENIKLVYLRRSLLQELSKEPESFENKVIGSFVRVKTDPHDYCQRNSHELLQVTGVKKSSSREKNAEMILLVSNMPLEIHISSLSDGDFEEAECVDLRQKVKDGVIQKLAVVELQQKARSLHKDITKNWIARELKLLDLRIEQACEKGRRRELYEYKEKRQQLQTPSEQSQLLESYPNVIAEELDPMTEHVHDRKENEASLQSVCPTDLNCKWGGNGTSRSKKYPGHASNQDGKKNFHDMLLPMSPNQAFNGKTNKTMPATLEGSPGQVPASENKCKVRSQGNDEMRSPSLTGAEQNQGIDVEPSTSKKQEPIVDKDVIDLGSDDETHLGALRKQNLEDPEGRVWFILGPNGERKGMYSLSLLKCWSEKCPYALKFKAWKETETEEQAIWLGDAIKLADDGK